MSELNWLAMSVLAALPGMAPNALPTTGDRPPPPPTQVPKLRCLLCVQESPEGQRSRVIWDQEAIAATMSSTAPQFSSRLVSNTSTVAKNRRPTPDLLTYLPPPTAPTLLRPTTGSQQYQQRLAALRAGMTYTRLPVSHFWETWSTASSQPSYEQWVSLLRAEARSMVRGQGNNQLAILLGDSISQWFPAEQLSRERFWLNQGISGDTTSGVLQRLSAFANTRPNTIHLMIGINDLRRGASDQEVLTNIDAIVRQLQQQHPQAQIVLYSILPTRLPSLPSQRIQNLNRVIAAIAQNTNSQFFDLYANFSDETGVLRRDLTTDGLHLSRLGYALWGWALQAVG